MHTILHFTRHVEAGHIMTPKPNRSRFERFCVKNDHELIKCSFLEYFFEHDFKLSEVLNICENNKLSGMKITFIGCSDSNSSAF